MDYKYSGRYFRDQVTRNQIWRKFMNKEDVLNAIDSVASNVAYMSKHPPDKLNHEDMEFMEKPLAELEVAIKKITLNNDLFGFTTEEIQRIIEKYEKIKERVEEIDIQRNSWD